MCGKEHQISRNISTSHEAALIKMGNWQSLNICCDNDQDSSHSSQELLVHPQKNPFLNFPDDLLLELVQYLSEFEVIELSEVNHDVRHRLKRKTRELFILHSIKNKHYSHFRSNPIALRFNEEFLNASDFPSYNLLKRFNASYLTSQFSKLRMVQCSIVHLPLIVQYSLISIS